MTTSHSVSIKGGEASSLSSISSTLPRTSEVLTMISPTDSTPGSTEAVSSPETGSLMSVTFGVSMTTSPNGQSTAAPFSTASQEIFTSPQNYHSMGTMRESRTSSLTGVTSSAFSSSPGGSAQTEAVSQDASLPSEASIRSASSVSSTPSPTPMVTRTVSADNGPGNTEVTSLLVTGTATSVTSEHSSTATLNKSSTGPQSSTSTQDMSVSPQNHSTPRTEATRESQTSSLMGVTSSVLLSSSGGSAHTEAVSQDASPPSEATTSSPSSVSSTPSPTPVVTRTVSADNGPGNTEVTSLPVTGTVTSVTSGDSSTATSNELSTGPQSSTSTQDMSVSPQNHSTPSMEATRESQTINLMGVTSSVLSSSPGGSAHTEAVSQDVSPPSEASTSSPSSVSSTPSPTPLVTRTVSADNSPGSTEVTSLPVTGTLTSVTSGDSSTATSNELSTGPQSSTSTQDMSVSPQNHSTPSMEATRESRTSSLMGVTSSALSSSPGGSARTEAVSQDTSPPSEASTSSPSSVGSTPSPTPLVTRTVPPDSAPGVTGDTSLLVTGSLVPVTSGISITGTTTSLSSPTSGLSSRGHALPDMSTPLPGFSSASFTDSHRTQSTMELSAGTSHDSTLGTRVKSAFVPSTFSPTMSDFSSTARPTDVSALTSLFTSSQETSDISKMVQTQSTGTTRGSETTSLFSLVTDIFSTATHSPPTSAPSGYMSPLTGTHAFLPSSHSPTFILTPVSDSRGTQATVPTLSSLITDRSSVAHPTTQSPVTPHSFSSVGPPGGEVPTTSPISAVHGSQTTKVSPSKDDDDENLPNTTQSPTSSVGISSMLTHVPPKTVQTATSTTIPRTNPADMDPTSSHGGTAGSVLTLSFAPTNYSSSKTTLEIAPTSKYPTLQTSADFSSSGSASFAKTGTDQSTPNFYTSISNSSFSHPPLGPIGSSTWSTSTHLPDHTTPLPVTSPSSPSTPTSGSTEKPETSGVTPTSLSTVAPPLPTASPTLLISTPSTPRGSQPTHPSGPVKPEPGDCHPPGGAPPTGVPLFPYGIGYGDRHFVRRAVDFTSRLFRIKIGFPLGSSLWDSCYFTDNGQIFFPESDYQIFPYPNPPPGGFTGRDRIATVAPFWADADFSSQKGEIFYQEYETLSNEPNGLVQQVETWIESFTNSRGYKAKWTLKVTWVNVTAYPSQQTSGTNTYQAILSTDGSRSYALFLYQSGGMRWDAAQRQDSPVLVGFSSGDGYFENSPLMSRPLWEKYRPDQLLHPKLDIRGLQIYRLHKEEKPSFRLRCLQRLGGQRPGGAQRPIFCPCSWQQGRWDLRFQPLSIGGRGPSGQHLCSFSWRGGVCCSYGPWGEFREGWSIRSPELLAWQLETQDWCCRWNDKPHFCALYREQWPRVGCAAYRPPRPAWMVGDPHITTLDGTPFTFNGLGDFLLVSARGGSSSFLLEGRTALTGSASATNFVAFAARYQADGLNPVTVRFVLGPNDTVRILHDDQTVTFESGQEDAADGFNATGVLLSRDGSRVAASFDGTVTIVVTALSAMLHATTSLPEEYRGHTEGLLGAWNGNPEDDFRMPNGSSLPHNSSEETLFHYGMTWALNGTGILGKRDSDLQPSHFTPVFLSALSGNSSLVPACEGDRWCIYDALATGDPRAGLDTRGLSRGNQLMNATLNQFPPSIHGCHVLKAYKDKTSRCHYTSDSKNATFTLHGNHVSFRLLENGTLLWTPESLEPVTLEILAQDAWTGLSSVLQPKAVACFCSARSQCLYNQTRRVGNSSLEEASCQCDKDSFGHHCEHSKDPCEERCFPDVQCTPGRGCGACPLFMTGDGRHCAALENPPLCQNESCPQNYCYNHGHCTMSQTRGCQPVCTCPPAFTDARCFLAGNTFVASILGELPVRAIQLSLREEENATKEDVDASVAHRLEHLDVQAFLRNSRVERSRSVALPSGRVAQQWKVVSEFGYRPSGPVIHFLNQQLLDAVVRAFLPRESGAGWKRSTEARNNVNFQPISRKDVSDSPARLNTSNLGLYFKCNGYEGYHLVYSPQDGVTCVSPCSEGHCHHGGQCQHLPDGPQCSCVSFSIYTSWGERCEQLSLRLGAFFGILFGALGALLLLGVVVAWVALRLRGPTKVEYPLVSEH